MAVFRAKLSSEEASSVEELRSFCFENGVVGIGWGVGDEQISDSGEYARKVSERWKDLDWSSEAWKRSHNALVGAKQHDWVWALSVRTGFWVGQFQDNNDWQYRQESDFRKLDLWQTRACVWRQVGSLGAVPGTVRNAFVGPGSTFCRVAPKDQSGTTEYLTAAAFHETGNEPVPACYRPNSIPKVKDETFVRHIPFDELEDIVGLYMQHELGWAIIPSTCKHGTASTEFEACKVVEGAAKKAHVQVKSGDQKLDNQLEAPPDVDEFFLFQAAAEIDKAEFPGQKMTPISRKDLWSWLQENLSLAPHATRRLLSMAFE
ncbi:hypothetical protein [Pyruvatibacter mobilis]|uniref:hypothetical protein n=1 Tax=Pyruvatibacter mobilis TaxID=1712261 RepID=UPI003C7D7D61